MVQAAAGFKERYVIPGTWKAYQDLTVPEKDRILGVTMWAPPHTYPTWSEGDKHAEGEWRRTHISPRLLDWVEKYYARRRG
jgi:hypothetical protein